MYLFCNSKIRVITLYSGHVCVYYVSMLRCWHLIWILVRTDHPCIGVGCHILHTYISLGAPLSRIPMPISPQNRTLDATQVPQCRWCPLSPPPLFQRPPFKLNMCQLWEAKDLTIGERITSKLDLLPPQSIDEVLPLFLIRLWLFRRTWSQSDVTGEFPLPYYRSRTLWIWNPRSIAEVIGNFSEL
jgi:hypothetical protein